MIQVKFFASLRDVVGCSEKSIKSEGVATAFDVWDHATDKIDVPANTLVAINKEYVDITQPVTDGDEVAFFPPVTGG